MKYNAYTRIICVVTMWGLLLFLRNTKALIA